MSLPQRLYELFREVANCVLVQSRQATPENMKCFEDLLNQSWSVDESEASQRTLIRGMYNSNQRGFYEYISLSRNRVGALVFWTESKCIARFFGLTGIVHVSWNEETNTYTITPYLPKELRADAKQENKSSNLNKGTKSRRFDTGNTNNNVRYPRTKTSQNEKKQNLRTNENRRLRSNNPRTYLQALQVNELRVPQTTNQVPESIQYLTDEPLVEKWAEVEETV